MPGQTVTDATSSKLEGSPVSRGFGLPMAIFVVVSSMIGVGVLTTSGFTVASVGSNQLMLFLWLVGGIIALCGALCVAELAAALPTSGGDYIYLYEAYGPLAAFLSGWVSFLIGFAAPIAASAFASASYLLAPLGLPPTTARLAHQGLATVAIVSFALIHTSKASHATRAHMSVTLLKLGILCTFLVAGLYAGWGRWENLADRPAVSLHIGSAMLFSLVYISYAYTGWNAASYIAGEIAEPGRRLPQAILIGTSLVVALYLGLNTVYSLALPAAEIQRIAKEQGFDAVAPIAELAAKRLFGSTITATLSVAFGLSLLASLSAYVLTGPRVAVAMARAGHFPAIAARLSAPHRSPRGRDRVAGGLGPDAALAGNLREDLDLRERGTGPLLDAVGEHGHRVAAYRPDLDRPFRTPGYPVVPAIFLIGTALLTIAVFLERPLTSLYSLLTILAGVPVYYLVRRPAPDGA